MRCLDTGFHAGIWNSAPVARISPPDKNNSDMKSFLPILIRMVLVFAVLFGLQYLIPYYLLTPAGILAGAFLLKTSDDRPLAWGVLAGSVVFGVFAYLWS